MTPRESKFIASLESRGITRRQFLAFCAGMASMLMLPHASADRIAKALAQQEKPVLVWLEFQDCAGNSESMLRSPAPTVTEIVLNTLSWEYHELIMAGAGRQAEDVLNRVVTEQRGQFIAIVEGAIPLADGGVYCTIGGRTAIDIARQVCPNAAVNIAIGSCAWDGGFVRSAPNPTGAVGLQEAVPGIKVMNLGGCPHNPANTAAAIVYYLIYNRLPALDQFKRPLFAHGELIHDSCPRRAHFDAGQFVEEWGDAGHRQGYCLYKMGCKGPQATWNCPTLQWNNGTNWPIGSGHNCVACASHRFWDVMSPFYQRLPNVPGIGGDVTVEQIGLGLTALTAVGFAAHGAASAIRAKARDRRQAQVAREEAVRSDTHTTIENGADDAENRS